MPAVTSPRGYPYPLDPDPIDVAGDIQKLAEAIDDDMGAAMETIQNEINALEADMQQGDQNVINYVDNQVAGLRAEIAAKMAKMHISYGTGGTSGGGFDVQLFMPPAVAYDSMMQVISVLKVNVQNITGTYSWALIELINAVTIAQIDITVPGVYQLTLVGAVTMPANASNAIVLRGAGAANVDVTVGAQYNKMIVVQAGLGSNLLTRPAPEDFAEFAGLETHALVLEPAT